MDWTKPLLRRRLWGLNHRQRWVEASNAKHHDGTSRHEADYSPLRRIITADEYRSPLEKTRYHAPIDTTAESPKAGGGTSTV